MPPDPILDELQEEDVRSLCARRPWDLENGRFGRRALDVGDGARRVAVIDWSGAVYDRAVEEYPEVERTSAEPGAHKPVGADLLDDGLGEKGSGAKRFKRAGRGLGPAGNTWRQEKRQT